MIHDFMYSVTSFQAQRNCPVYSDVHVGYQQNRSIGLAFLTNVIDRLYYGRKRVPAVGRRVRIIH